MNRSVVFFLVTLLTVVSLRADQQTLAAQQQLKDRGFYYGAVDGQGGAETTSAIKRFQIREGLQVTGTLTQETMNALSVSGQPAPAPPQPQKKAKSAITTGTPPPKVVESDRHLLDRVLHPAAEPQPTPVRRATPPPNVTRETPQYYPPQRGGVLPPPVDLYEDDATGSLASFFARTPYENAPVSVQMNTVRQAQSTLRRRGYYNAEIDGDPGPGTQRALAFFQRDNGLRSTGRLDTDTLLEMNLMPGTLLPSRPRYPRYGAPAYDPFQGQPVYRGIRVR